MGVVRMDLAGMGISRAKDTDSRERSGGTKKRSAFQVHEFLSLIRDTGLPMRVQKCGRVNGASHAVTASNVRVKADLPILLADLPLAEDVERPL